MINPRIFIKGLLVPSLLIFIEPSFVPVIEVVEFLRGTITCGKEERVVFGMIVGHQTFSNWSYQEDNPEEEGLISVASHKWDQYGSVSGSDEIEDGKLWRGFVFSNNSLLAVTMVVPYQETDPTPNGIVVL